MQLLHLHLLVALLGLFALVSAQGVTENLYPPSGPPAGCKQTVNGQFEITVLEHSLVAGRGLLDRDASHRLEKRKECGHEGVLVVTLTDSVTKDALQRTGYVASNFQFQFDAPAQAGAMYTAGFSLCGNGLLALGNSTQFWKCKSGDFWNLYDRHWAEQCDPVALKAMPCGADAGGAQHGGTIVGTDMVTTTEIRPIADGQPQVITTVVPIPMCQIGDGQIQAHTTPCASLTAPPAVTGTPVSQITDGQIQVPPPGSGDVAPTTTISVISETTPVPTPTGNETLITAPPSPTVVPTSPPSTPSVLPTSLPVGGGAAQQKMGFASSALGVFVAAAVLVAL